MSETSKQPTYMRQRFLLAFVRQLNGYIKSTDLQKLVFLYLMREGQGFYDFLPYKYGSYSFQLAEDIDILRMGGYISIDYKAEGNSITAIGEYNVETAYTITAERGDALISKAYREYPYYAMNSEIIERLFFGEELERFENLKNTYSRDGDVLFTIGYEGKSIESFINLLIQNDIRILCDVRKNPISRKFGFSKGKLEHIAQAVGIKYVHVPGLGIESDKRSSLESVEDYEELFDDYEKTLLNRKRLLDEVYSLLNSDHRIALMCYEGNPDMCHRHVIRDYLINEHMLRSIDL